MDYLEIIKNILVSLASFFIVVGLLIFYIKIYFNWVKIKQINNNIEKGYDFLDKTNFECEFDWEGDEVEADVVKRDLFISKTEIKKLKRQKEYLMEEISILKIFKK